MEFVTIKLSPYSPNYPELVINYPQKVSIVASPRTINAVSFEFYYLGFNAFTNWCMDIFYEADARWERRSDGIWKI